MDLQFSEQHLTFRTRVPDLARKSIAPVAREWNCAGRYPEERDEDHWPVRDAEAIGEGIDDILWAIIARQFVREDRT